MENRIRPRKRFKALLAVSLAANLLFVGIFAGAFWRNSGPGGRPHGGPGMQDYAMPYVRALPDAARRTLHRAVREKHPRQDRVTRREGYAQMLEALRTTPFDAAAVQAVAAAQRDASVGVLRTAQDQWMSLVTTMSASERADYADRLEERLKRGPRRKGKRRDSEG